YWATVGAPSFDHQPIADDHPHVTGAWGLSFSCHIEKDQVTGLLFALRHSWAEVPLILGDPGNRHTDTFVGLHGQSGAVKTIRSGTTPDIRFSALVKGPINHFLCQLVGGLADRCTLLVDLTKDSVANGVRRVVVTLGVLFGPLHDVIHVPPCVVVAVDGLANIVLNAVFQQVVSGCGDRVRRVVDIDDPVVVTVDPVAAFRSVLHRLDRLTTPAVARSRVIEGTELHRPGRPPVVVSLRDAGAVPTPVV